MSDAYIDADVIVRLLSGDDLDKQARAASLFAKVEQRKLSLTTPLTTIADVVYVLSSPRLYDLPKTQVAALLDPLIRLPNFKITSRRMALLALQLYVTTHVDFGDALIAAAARLAGPGTVYSFDHHFDRFGGVERKEP